MLTPGPASAARASLRVCPSNPAGGASSRLPQSRPVPLTQKVSPQGASVPLVGRAGAGGCVGLVGVGWLGLGVSDGLGGEDGFGGDVGLGAPPWDPPGLLPGLGPFFT